MRGDKPKAPKYNWKSSSGSNSVAIVSWAALISMFSAVFVSIVWETYFQSSRGEAAGAHNESYVYPTFILDYEEQQKDRKQLQEFYGYDYAEIHKMEIERRDDLELEEFWDLYDVKWWVELIVVYYNFPEISRWAHRTGLSVDLVVIVFVYHPRQRFVIESLEKMVFGRSLFFYNLLI